MRSGADEKRKTPLAVVLLGELAPFRAGRITADQGGAVEIEPGGRRGDQHRQRDRRQTARIAAEQRGRDLQDEIAGDAADADRQRPSGRRLDAAERRAEQDDAADGEPAALPDVIDAVAADQPQRPDHRQADDQRRADAEDLHHQIGDDRPGGAGGVLDHVQVRLAQRGIGDRPCRTGKAEIGRQEQEADRPRHFQTAPKEGRLVPADRYIRHSPDPLRLFSTIRRPWSRPRRHLLEG